MLRRFAILILLCLPLAIAGCSAGNSSAPEEGEPHPSDWLQTHPAAALAVDGFADCTGCHGNNLKGNGNAVSCYSCHQYNSTPPFKIHPTADIDQWYFDHRDYAKANGAVTCAKCHGADLHGSSVAPSCFSSSFDSKGCHPDGPGTAPHVLDGSFLEGSVHGPVAKVDFTVCQACHGEPGGPGSNPRFNLGILNSPIPGTGCEGCHNDHTAHPSVGEFVTIPAGGTPRDNAHWYGAEVTCSTSGNLAACALCHGANYGGPAEGGVGPACIECHITLPADNPTGCVSCHDEPPDGAGLAGNVRPNRQGQHNRPGHSLAISGIPSETCARCHNGAGYQTDLHFDHSSPADVIFTHPDGTDTISAVSDSNNTTCNGACHITGDGVDFSFDHINKTWY